MYNLQLTAEEVKERLQRVQRLSADVAVHSATYDSAAELIRIDLGYTIEDGSEIKFKSPVAASRTVGLIVYYPDEVSNIVTKEFTFADAHGNNVGAVDHLFAEGAVVKVILDLDTNNAFVQNADTNAYLENQFNSINDQIDTLRTHGYVDLNFTYSGPYAFEEALGNHDGSYDSICVLGTIESPARPTNYSIDIFETNETRDNLVIGEHYKTNKGPDMYFKLCCDQISDYEYTLTLYVAGTTTVAFSQSVIIHDIRAVVQLPEVFIPYSCVRREELDDRLENMASVQIITWEDTD